MPKDLGSVISDIDRRLDDKEWTLRVEAVSRAGELLSACDDATTLERVIGLIERGARDDKWEVRKAAAFVLGKTTDARATALLATLSEDENPWVKKAALVAQRRSGGASHADQTLDRMVSVIKRLKRKSLAREEMLELARFFGDLHYEDLASDTAHELRSVVTAIDGQALVIDDRLRALEREDPVLAEASARLRLWTRALTRTVEDLCYYTSSRGTFGIVRLAAVVGLGLESARARLDPARVPQGLQVTAEISPEIELEADQDRLARALGNLVCNAIQALPAAGPGVVKVTSELVEATSIRLAIADNGKGMDAQQIQDARKRYRSLRKAEGGVGLGVPIAERIIEREHHGRLEIESTLGQGTTVIVTLPRVQPKEGR